MDPGVKKGPGGADTPRMDTNTAREECSTCLLTAPAALLFAGLVRQLQETRGDDGSWETTTCPDCGQITDITDHPEGWTFEDMGSSFETKDKDANASSRGPDTTPEWVTPAEAAFLIRGSKQTILEWIEAGRLESEAVIGSDRPFVLVRTIDVRALAEDNGT